MLGPEEQIMEEFYKNYPDLDKHSADRHCVAGILEFLLNEFSYQPALYGNEVIDSAEIAFLIKDLRETWTLDEPSQDPSLSGS